MLFWKHRLQGKSKGEQSSENLSATDSPVLIVEHCAVAHADRMREWDFFRKYHGPDASRSGRCQCNVSDPTETVDAANWGGFS